MDVTASANAIVINRYFNLPRRRLGYPYWSLSIFLKHKVKTAVSFVSDFEQLVAGEARRREVDTVVRGHIHKAELRYIDEIPHCNAGDWVESCSAMVENHEGVLSIVHWADEQLSCTGKPNSHDRCRFQGSRAGRAPRLLSRSAEFPGVEVRRLSQNPGDIFVIGLNQIGPILSFQTSHGEVAVGHVLKMLHEDQVDGCSGRRADDR